MANESVTIPWLKGEYYTVNGIPMVYMLNKEKKGDDYIATYDMGLLKKSQLELMGFTVTSPNFARLKINPREVVSK